MDTDVLWWNVVIGYATAVAFGASLWIAVATRRARGTWGNVLMCVALVLVMGTAAALWALGLELWIAGPGSAMAFALIVLADLVWRGWARSR